MLQPARLGDWIPTVMKCTKQTKKSREYRRKDSLDTFTSHVTEAGNARFEQVCKLVQICYHDEQNSGISESDSNEGRTEKVLCQSRRARPLDWASFEKGIFITVGTAWFMKYVGEQLGHFYGCHTSKISEKLEY